MAKKEEKQKNIYIKLVSSDGGRPKKILTQDGLNLVATLSQYMATDEEIAAALSNDEVQISVDTLTRENNKEAFAEYKRKGQSRGKTSLRSWQFDTAKKGNATMQIWLGRQYLGQTDRQEIEQTGGGAININVVAATEADREEF